MSSSNLEYEEDIGLESLTAGMIISRPIQNNRGEILVAKDFELTGEVLEGLWQRQLNQESFKEIYVYKSSVVQHKMTA
jgi:hypothetical protein